MCQKARIRNAVRREVCSVKSGLLRALIFGLFTASMGLGLSILPAGVDIEENTGLEILFHLRGTRPAPSDVVVVSIDKKSSDRLNLSYDPRKWSRTLHARLIENLQREGAAVIGFDLVFEEPHQADEDRLFAEAIGRVPNVVLCERLKSDRSSLIGKRGTFEAAFSTERLVPPLAPLAQSAVALAPMPLPKVPVRVSQYWMFKSGAGDVPTFPVVVFQLFTMGAFDEFIRVLEKVSPYPIDKQLIDKGTFIKGKGVPAAVSRIREIFQREPLLAERMVQELRSSEKTSESKKRRMVKLLVKMYGSGDSQYLNFYGPPRTITTIPYHQVLSSGQGASKGGPVDVKNKVVLIGLSESAQPEQRDGYHTVFSQPDGLDISGVEIAATALANLLEDMPVRVLSVWAHVSTVVLWGVVISTVCLLLPTGIAAVSVVGASVLYLVGAVSQFKTAGLWFPVIVPLFFQTSFAFFGALLLKYFQSNKERKNIRKAFGYYLPAEVIDQLEKNIGNLEVSSQVVYGICLSTDAERYTSLSETMEPRGLGSLMNRYYEAVFSPVRKYGGMVSNVIGDSMLAIWVARDPDPALRHKACLAALDIAEAIKQFGRSSDGSPLPTRIGVHSGQILLGNVGALDHYEYRPVGDIVNTASRVENLNKYLGTRVLVSGEVIHQLDSFLVREMGEFLLAGKSKPIVVHELLCRKQEATEQQRRLCATFAEALDALKRQSWDEAFERFHEVVKITGKDGPSKFYMKLCEEYKKAPGESWNGIVTLDKK